MLQIRTLSRLGLSLWILLLSPLVAQAEPGAGEDAVLQALDTELKRSMDLLQSEETVPYFIGLEAMEVESVNITGEEGGLQGYRPKVRRYIHADVRLGTPKLDSTHPLRDDTWEWHRSGSRIPAGDEVEVLQHGIWEEIDTRYRAARDRLQRVQANQQVLVKEEKPSWDLAPSEASRDLSSAPSLSDLDMQKMEESIRTASAVFADSPDNFDPSVSLRAEAVTQWFVSSEGHRIRHGDRRFRLAIHVDSIADDGDELSLYHSFDTANPGTLPDTDELVAAARALETQLIALRAAPREEPYNGPAILGGRAAAVFFHEIFGHRVEGHRLKEVHDAQTFRNQVGKEILPPFLSVHDDPTTTRIAGVDLRGSYRYDNQGTRAERVTLVDKGELKGFLESRSPVEATGRSNAHGRRQAGRAVVTRQGNLLITAHKTVSQAKLRKRLRAMARKAGQEYGLYVEDISGGFTFTGREIPNAFNINVVLARRVFVDGRPDELVRGVDLIGTPLQTFSKVVAASDVVEVFNGSCGAESGWVPVSAASPALLVSQVETQRKVLAQAKPPLLPPPSSEADNHKDVLLTALVQNARRAADKLKMPDAPAPGWVEMRAWDVDRHTASGDFGVLSNTYETRYRPVEVEVVVGDNEMNSSRIEANWAEDLPWATTSRSLVVDDVMAGMNRDLWTATDASYKAALRRYAYKKTVRKNTVGEAPPPDLVPVDPVVYLDDVTVPSIRRGQLNDLATAISGGLRGMGLLSGSTVARSIQGKRYVVRSDGTRIREPYGYVVVYSWAQAVRSDGLRLSDDRQWVARTLDDLPSADEMAKDTAAMGRALMTRISAEKVAHYEGPVVFEGAAATQLFAQLLPPSLQGTPPPPESGKSYQQLTMSGPRLKRRVLPQGWKVVDDPSSIPRGHAGLYRYDDDGVPAQSVELVRNGLVVDLAMSRVPRQDVKGSNGHARGDSARLTAWRVTPSRSLGDRAFDRKVDALRRESDLKRVLVIRQLGGTLAGTLVSPDQAVWRYPDGREEPVLALEFQGVDRRTLRDVAAVGRGTRVVNYLAARSPKRYFASTSGLPMVVTTPDKVVVKNLELVFPGAEDDPLVVPPPPMKAMKKTDTGQ